MDLLLKMDKVLEITVSETKDGVLQFCNVFFESGGKLFVGRSPTQVGNVDSAPPLSELTNVEAIPLSTFPRYEEGIFGKVFYSMPHETYLKRPRLLAYFANKNAIAESMIEEAKVFTRIETSTHPHLAIRVGSFVKDDRVLGVILPRYECSLQNIIEEKKNLQLSEVSTEVRSTLHHLHSIGFAHNDVHLGNIMLCANERAVLIDLEFCRRLGDEIANIRKRSSVANNVTALEQVERVVALHEMRRTREMEANK